MVKKVVVNTKKNTSYSTSPVSKLDVHKAMLLSKAKLESPALEQVQTVPQIVKEATQEVEATELVEAPVEIKENTIRAIVRVPRETHFSAEMLVEEGMWFRIKRWLRSMFLS